MKMLVSDYDNTLYTSESEIVKNVEAINKFMENNIFVIATGRSYLDFKRLKEKYHINYNYLIINYGATIIKNDVVVYNEIIDNKIKDKIFDILNLGHVEYSFNCSFKESRTSFKNADVTKIHARYQTKEEAYNIYEKLLASFEKDINCYFVNHGYGVEVVSKKVDKALAIQKLVDMEKLQKIDIYTVGDSYSDIGMIKKFNGVALPNSIPEIKKQAIKEVSSVFDLINKIDK